MLIENLLVLEPEAEVEGYTQTELYHRGHRHHSMRIGSALHPLPCASEVTAELGTIAVVHGNVPLHISHPYPENHHAQYGVNLTWAECKARVHEHDEETVYNAQWTTHRDKECGEGRGPSVPDVDLVVGGHDHLAKRRLTGDYLSIDYGTGHREHREWATLCAVQIHPGMPRLFHYGPADEKAYRAHWESISSSHTWECASYRKLRYRGYVKLMVGKDTTAAMLGYRKQRCRGVREVPYPPIEPGRYAEDHTADDQEGDEDND